MGTPSVSSPACPLFPLQNFDAASSGGTPRGLSRPTLMPIHHYIAAKPCWSSERAVVSPGSSRGSTAPRKCIACFLCDANIRADRAGQVILTDYPDKVLIDNLEHNVARNLPSKLIERVSVRVGGPCSPCADDADEVAAGVHMGPTRGIAFRSSRSAIISKSIARVRLDHSF
jgi:hypothetical protein